MGTNNNPSISVVPTSNSITVGHNPSGVFAFREHYVCVNHIDIFRGDKVASSPDIDSGDTLGLIRLFQQHLTLVQIKVLMQKRNTEPFQGTMSLEDLVYFCETGLIRFTNRIDIINVC